jgi:hypothetical protein
MPSMTMYLYSGFLILLKSNMKKQRGEITLSGKLYTEGFTSLFW